MERSSNDLDRYFRCKGGYCINYVKLVFKAFNLEQK